MSFFPTNADIIDSKLKDYFNSILSRNIYSDSDVEVLGHIREFTLRGGKRIRASLVEIGYRFFHEKENIDKKTLEKLHQLGIVMELLQSFFLIHDDIIDKAPLRRGLKTLHLIWKEKFGDDLHMGESMGILAGNYALVNSYGIIENLDNTPDKTKLALITLLNKVIQDTLSGQIIDVQISYKTLKETTEQEILDIMTLKTAKYTIVAPLQFGAILANASSEDINSISSFGVPFGLAFQISDDIIGTFGKEDKTGKSINSDLKEGKKTLFIIDTFNKADEEERKRIDEILGKENLPDDQYNFIRTLVSKYSSLNYAKSKIEKYAKEGETRLNSFKGHSEAKKILNDFAFDQINRSS
jgi:geranylgeranyl diphosphate synthase type I